MVTMALRGCHIVLCCCHLHCPYYILIITFQSQGFSAHLSDYASLYFICAITVVQNLLNKLPLIILQGFNFMLEYFRVKYTGSPI